MMGEADPLLGRSLLGRYRVIRPLARGGMGVVYLGRTEGAAGFSRPVVIKRVLPDLVEDPNMTKMFVREARILSQLQHEGIVGVVDFGEEDHAYIMVLEYVHGYDLGRWHKYVNQYAQGLPAEWAIDITIRILEALHYAHTLTRDGKLLQVVHRDISPGNILLDVDGRIKLVDFGIARMEFEMSEFKTREGVFKGKLSYAAPELLQGLPATPQSDMYSCAVVLYQLMSGVNPFRGRSMPDTVNKVLNELPTSIHAVCEGAPPEMDEIFLTALAKQATNRYPSAEAFAQALRDTNRRPQSEIQSELSEQLRRDFEGEMPLKLGLEPLQVRDSAWRDAQSTDDTPGLALESTPPLTGASRPSYGHGRTETTALDVAAPRPAGSSRVALWIASVAAILSIGVTLLFVFVRRPEAAPARFLVVESTAGDNGPDPESPAIDAVNGPLSAGPTPQAEPGATASAAPAGSVPEPQPTALPTGTGAVEPGQPAKPNPALLSATFRRQQPRVQGCFSTHAKEVEGQPQISVQFSVDKSGSVKSANLSPASIASTPLGGCLLGIARKTNFGRQTEPVKFSIPITAKRVK